MDHVGHTFESDHIEMKRKLNQYSEIVEKVN